MARLLLGPLQVSSSTWSASCVNQALRLASDARRDAGACNTVQHGGADAVMQTSCRYNIHFEGRSHCRLLRQVLCCQQFEVDQISCHLPAIFRCAYRVRIGPFSKQSQQYAAANPPYLVIYGGICHQWLPWTLVRSTQGSVPCRRGVRRAPAGSRRRSRGTGPIAPPCSPAATRTPASSAQHGALHAAQVRVGLRDENSNCSLGVVSPHNTPSVVVYPTHVSALDLIHLQGLTMPLNLTKQCLRCGSTACVLSSSASCCFAVCGQQGEKRARTSYSSSDVSRSIAATAALSGAAARTFSASAAWRDAEASMSHRTATLQARRQSSTTPVFCAVPVVPRRSEVKRPQQKQAIL